MNAARDLGLGVIADLRERRLLPVAALLLALVLVVPVVLHKSAAKPAASATPAAQRAPASVDGLPGPAQALKDQQPLVTLTTLNKPSNLQTFKGRNPFKPLTPIASTDSSGATSTASSPSTSAGSATDVTAGTGGGSGAPSPSDTSGGGTSAGGGTSTGGGSGTGTQPETNINPKKVKVRGKYTYEADMTMTTPHGKKRYRHLQKLQMLPSSKDPMLIFLGVTSDGRNALFLISSTLRPAGGDGAHCRPSLGRCAAVWFQNGDSYNFLDGQNRKYTLKLTKIHQVLIKDSIKKASTSGASAGASSSSPSTLSDFFPPLVDLITSSR